MVVEMSVESISVALFSPEFSAEKDDRTIHWCCPVCADENRNPNVFSRAQHSASSLEICSDVDEAW